MKSTASIRRNYGIVTLNKAVTIDCGGAFGSITVPDTSAGIMISAGSSDVVTIRNLSIRGQPGASTNMGILYSIAKAVHPENVAISGMADECIELELGGAGLITVDNATLTGCSAHGVRVATTSTTSSQTAVANINNTRISNVLFGVTADNGSRVAIRDSTIYLNIRAVQQTTLFGTALGSTVTILNSTLGYSSEAAVRSITGEFILVFGNAFVNDVMALNPGGGTIFTGGDNINSGSTQGTANGGSVTKF